MTTDEALKFIESTQGRIFSCEFTKRSTGETRRMVCRTGVSYVRGELGSGPSYSAAEKGLIRVWDMEHLGWRVIPVEGIQRIKVRGQWHKVEPQQLELFPVDGPYQEKR